MSATVAAPAAQNAAVPVDFGVDARAIRTLEIRLATSFAQIPRAGVRAEALERAALVAADDHTALVADDDAVAGLFDDAATAFDTLDTALLDLVEALGSAAWRTLPAPFFRSVAAADTRRPIRTTIALTPWLLPKAIAIRPTTIGTSVPALTGLIGLRRTHLLGTTPAPSIVAPRRLIARRHHLTLLLRLTFRSTWRRAAANVGASLRLCLPRGRNLALLLRLTFWSAWRRRAPEFGSLRLGLRLNLLRLLGRLRRRRALAPVVLTLFTRGPLAAILAPWLSALLLLLLRGSAIARTSALLASVLAPLLSAFLRTLLWPFLTLLLALAAILIVVLFL